MEQAEVSQAQAKSTAAEAHIARSTCTAASCAVGGRAVCWRGKTAGRRLGSRIESR